MEENKLTNFLIKLWSILEDNSITDAICWDRSGKSFHILDLYKFCEVVLPRFFKHNKMSSFVRQLNLYGFKKIPTVDRSTLVYTDNITDHMQFAHAYFRRGQPHLLTEIKRSASKRQVVAGAQDMDIAGGGEKMVTLPESDLICMLEELDTLRGSHSHMENTIHELSRDNELLWNEVALLRDSHLKQQQNVGKLVQFLISLVQPNSNSSQKHSRMGGSKRIVPIVDDQGSGGGNPLALAVSEKPSWDILACIQQDILSEALNYSTMSALSPPSPNEHEVGTDQRQMFDEPIISTAAPLPKSTFNPGVPSPRNQLSMHLTNTVKLPYTQAINNNNYNNKALLPKSNNNQQLIRYQIPQPKATSKRIHVPSSPNNYVVKYSNGKPVDSYEYDQDDYVEEYGQYEEDMQPGPSTSSSSATADRHHHYIIEAQPKSSFEYMEDDFVHVEGNEEEMADQNFLTSSPQPMSSPSTSSNVYNETIEANNNHELMLYDAMNAIVEHPWNIN